MTKNDHFHNCMTHAIEAIGKVNAVMCQIDQNNGLTPILDAALSSLLVVAEECLQGLKERESLDPVSMESEL